ncbi:hypothetical protein [Streptomyces sp. NPDC047841]|uniref:hypothetical protein n=1 Tax=Streptomyces sp. NPDC047841 TaxID=3154708 RepID=UPI003451B5E3
MVLPELYRTFVAEIANGTDDGLPDAGGLLPVGEKPESRAVWEAEYWMSRAPSMPRTAPVQSALPVEG